LPIGQMLLIGKMLPIGQMLLIDQEDVADLACACCRCGPT
jgi:hypothetical protein